MHTFQELLKRIRRESDLTQEEFARVLGVSTILVALLESGKREVSKAFILKLADKLEVQPGTITPFLLPNDKAEHLKLSRIERSLFGFGETLQTFLIEKRAKNLQKYVKTR